MLDEFSTINNNNHSPKPERNQVPRDSITSNNAETDDLEKDLQAQMAALVVGLEDSPEVKREFDNVVKDIQNAADDGSFYNPAKTEEAFQKSIRKTVERMQASSDQAGSAMEQEGSDDFLGQIMKEMHNNDLPAGDDNEGLNKMLMGMMEQLTNKDILYDPMKELDNKFPAWIGQNEAKTMPEDMKRYEQQQELVQEIVGRFERKDYSDSNAADREFIVDRMQQVRLLSPLKPMSLTEHRCKPLVVLQPTLSVVWKRQTR